MTQSSLVLRARAIAPTLAERAAESEEARRIPADLSAALGREGFYRMLVPAALGGGEVHPRVFAHALSELARGDGAAAWVAMTGSTTGLLLAYLAPERARAILDDAPEAALAGVFAPTGRLLPVDGGYRLSGRWRYGSGCENARWRMGGALVMEEGGPRRLASGAVEIRSCFFREDESEVIDTWRVAGLRGTGSHDLAVSDVRVDAEQTACLLADSPRHDGALYRVPVFGLLATGVGAVGLGLARAALDHLIALALEKRSRGGGKSMAESELVQVALAEAEGRLGAARAFLDATLDQVFEHARTGEPAGDAQRARLRLAATHAATVSAGVVDEAYRLAGGASIWDAHPLSRCFRDAHVMTQHLMVARETLKPVGRLLLDLETDTSQL